MKSLRVRASINTSPADVYHVLTDYEHYEQWNPWLHVIRGEAVQGGHLVLKPRSWIFFLPVKYQFDKVERPALLQRTQVGWTHYFFITKRERAIYTKTNGSSLYTSSLSFEGPLAGIAQFMFGRIIHQGMKKETQALKNFCEEHFSLGAPKKNRHQVLRSKFTESKPKKIDVPDAQLANSL